MLSTKEFYLNQKVKKMLTLTISVFVIMFAMFVLFGNQTQAVENFGELYKLEDGYITNILPKTTVNDLKNNLETEGQIVVTNQAGKVLQEDEYVGTGMKLKLNGKTYKLSVTGDLDGNGRITITDLTKIRLYLSNLKEIEKDYQKAIDINGSGTHTITDYTQFNLSIIGIKDIIAPPQFVPTAIRTTDTITVTGKTVDENSGVAQYFFKLDDGKWVQNTDKTKGTYTFKNLDENKTYTIKMKVQDKAGNERITESINVELPNGELEIIPSTTEWTNKDVTIAIETNSNTGNLNKVISVDGGKTFEKYTRPIKVDKNTTVVAKLLDSNNETMAEKELKITNIDKLPPKQFEIGTTVGLNTVKVTVQTQDTTATSEYGQSGISHYEYISIRGFWEWKEESTKTSHEFATLIQGETYTIKVVAVDNAGNRTVSEKTIKTKSMEELGEITLIPSTTDWTKDDITVTGTYPEFEGITKQISIDNGATWNTYTEPVKVSANTTVKARILDADGNAGREVTLVITKIDKEKPNAFVVSTETTTDTITVTGSTTDALSGIKAYYYSKDNGVTWQEENVFSGLTPNTTYNIKMKAVDNVGNEYITQVKETKTTAVYTLTVNANSGVYTGQTSITQEANTTTTISNPTKEGYTFKGWSIVGKGSIQNGVFTFGDGDAVLTAEWEAVTYTISYNLNGGTVTGNPTNYSVTTNTITLINPTKTGYTFAGWTGTGLSSATTTVTIAKGSTGDKTYTANWTVNKYTLTYNPNEGTVSPTSTTADYGSSITMPTPTRSYTVSFNVNGGNALSALTANYTFNGWYTAVSGGSKKTYTTMPANNETLYARWTSKSVTLPTPTKSGYVFDGWYTDSGLSTLAGEAGATYTPSANITLYAKWLEEGIFVKLYTDGTLAFSSTDKTISGKTLKTSYGNVENEVYNKDSGVYAPWLEVYYSQELPQSKTSSLIKNVTIVDEIAPISTNGWFLYLELLESINNIENLNTSQVTDMAWMFGMCESLTSLDLRTFDTSKVTNMSSMFSACSSLKTLNLSSFNTSNVTNMNRMFFWSYSLTSLDLSSFDTSKVTNMSEMFSGDVINGSSLTRIIFGEKFITSNVTTMVRMFSGCNKLTTLDLRTFDTSNVTDMSYMFANCSELYTIYVTSKFVRDQADTTGMMNGCDAIIASGV